MLTSYKSIALMGLDGYITEVEVDMSLGGLPGYDTVGLADTAVKESKERIHSAIKNSGYRYPSARVVVNLAPADVKKEGTYFDLAIALGILASSGQLKSAIAPEYVIIGELSLVGKVRRVNGVLPILISAKQQGYTKAIIPFDNRGEAVHIEGMEVIAVESLREACEVLEGKRQPQIVEHIPWKPKRVEDDAHDMKYIKGQYVAKRALEIAIAGEHNVLFIGPPGAGKSMLAKAVPTVMPDMTFEEALETTKIHSIAGFLDERLGFLRERPFRSPHHTATPIALVGGGRNAKPGEVSLANNGVLFLDELPEYSRHVLETLRQPIEDGYITVSRHLMIVKYPCKFTLVASMNPCPCGNYGSKKHECTCSASQIHRYRAKLSGPLMDRIDIHVEVDGVSFEDLSDKSGQSESSAVVRARIEKARAVQAERFKGTDISYNAQMSNAQMKDYCKIDERSNLLLKTAFDRLNLSARGYNRILKVARTIADLDGSEQITSGHVAEALQYRSYDKNK
ncbi:MAG: YifB family Mg chelatase-like AAA ATPase [Clostridia bacterium]|nr:YifB family Mg chelatase-like AAA ATPase [Clostridia bacterium]